MRRAGNVELPLLAGSIDVAAVVAEAAERERFAARQRRELEWIALKAWWHANRALKRAERRGKAQLMIEAQRDVTQVAAQYGEALASGLKKWEAVQQELRRRGYRRLD